MKQEIIKKALIIERNRYIKELIDKGFNYSEIGFILNKAHTTILRIVNKK